MRKWRNWQTRTFEGRVVLTIRVQVPSSAPMARGGNSRCGNLEKSRSWSSAHDWKSCNGQKPFESSNLSFSATKRHPQGCLFRIPVLLDEIVCFPSGGVTFPRAKFEDKHRPAVGYVRRVCICSLSTALRRIRLFAKIVLTGGEVLQAKLAPPLPNMMNYRGMGLGLIICINFTRVLPVRATDRVLPT